MSNFSFEISHFTGKTTRILSVLQGLFPSSDWFDLKFKQKISKIYIINMPRTFLCNNYFLLNFCFVICHLTGKSRPVTATFELRPLSILTRNVKVARGIVIFRTLSLYSISNKSISSLSFNCGHDLRHAL